MPPAAFPLLDQDEEKQPLPSSRPESPRLSFPARFSYSSERDHDYENDASPLLYHDERSHSFDFSPTKRSADGSFSPNSPASPPSPSFPSYSATLRRTRRSKRLASLGFTVAVVAFVATCAFAAVVMGWSGHVLYARWHSHRRAGKAVEQMVPDPTPVEGLVPAFPTWTWTKTNEASTARADSPATSSTVSPSRAGRVEAIQDELDARLATLDLPASNTLPCSSLDANPSLLSRYSPLRGLGPSPSHARSGTTFLALNLYNSENVLPSLSRTLLTLSSFLGPETVHVSIFENGSTDNTTVALAHLAAALTALGTPHTIVSDPRKTDWKSVDRIETLALYRNIALEPLEGAPLNGTTQAEDIVFINDVFVCPADVLELVFQRKVQRADAACALDWQPSQGVAALWDIKVKVYDSWVVRSITGHTVRSRFDLIQQWRDGVKAIWDQAGEEYSRARFDKGVPIPVYSCWNGVVAFTALPFTSSSLSPRYNPSSPEAAEPSWARTAPTTQSNAPVRFRAGRKSEGECAASECKIIARDFWTRGFDRWLVVPTVRVTYDEPTYSHRQLVELSSRNPPSASSLSLSSPPSKPSSSSSAPAPLDPLDERIAWPSLTAPKKVLCFGWNPRLMIDIEWLAAVWESPYSPARLVDWGVPGRGWLPW